MKATKRLILGVLVGTMMTCAAVSVSASTLKPKCELSQDRTIGSLQDRDPEEFLRKIQEMEESYSEDVQQ